MLNLLLLKTQEFHEVFSPYGPHEPCMSKSIGVLEKDLACPFSKVDIS